MHEIFEVHMLNEAGKKRAQRIAEAFDLCLESLEVDCGAGVARREFSVAKTKLEEACFFAKKAMAKEPENQA